MLAMHRMALDKLLEWKNRNARKPLILRGARQVGKTTLIHQFSKHFKQYIYLNLEKPAHKRYFQTIESVQDIIAAIYLQEELTEDHTDTLLFIDEIQESPEAIAMLRYFYEEMPDLPVIAAGSLLEMALREVKSFPVGRIQYMYLFPLNFREFLRATGKRSALAAFETIPLPSIAHQVLMDNFHLYALLGGMPEVLKQYIQTGNMSGLHEVYEGIWSTYRSDVQKYAGSETERKVIFHLMNTAHNFLDERVTFQHFGNSSYRSREVGEAFRSLDDAKVIQLIHPTTDVEIPARTDLKKKPRMQFLDIGLVNNALNIQHELVGIKDLSNAHRGALIPQIVTQELISKNIYSFKKPHFWVREKSQSSAEVDLVISYKNYLIPVEIKSGKVGKLRSLHQFIEQCPHHFAIRLYAGKMEITLAKTPGGKPFKLLNLPYFLGMFLPEYIQWFVENENSRELQ